MDCQDQDHRDRGGHQHHHHHHDHHDPFNTGGAGREQGPGFLVRGHLVETGWIIAGLSLQYITKIQCMKTCMKGSIGKILSAQNLLNRHQVSTAFILILYFLTQSWLWAISSLE